MAILIGLEHFLQLDKINLLPKIHMMIVYFIVWVIMTSSVSATAQPAPFQEYVVKGAFLYNFARFVEWPQKAFANEQDPLTICILGEDPFDNALDQLRGKTTGKHKIQVRQHAALSEIYSCNILFISKSEQDKLAEILSFSHQRRVLTVSDMENFAAQGGVIGLITVQNKIRFEVNLEAARRADLRISSQLLKLAIIVKE
ncbi:MAG: YfiR family protein [Desulforhabdus sp.]|jgi:hypothetical protein|nr:YfiR family protein [Desulforhabdus sp.]